MTVGKHYDFNVRIFMLYRKLGLLMAVKIEQNLKLIRLGDSGNV